jgi:hypothetical protein
MSRKESAATVAIILSLVLAFAVIACSGFFTFNTAEAATYFACYSCYGSCEILTDIPETCREEGLLVARCNACDIVYENPIDPLGHDYQQQWYIPATCEVDGEEYYRCSRCDDKYFIPISRHGHDWGDWETVVEPSVYREGEQRRVCRFDEMHLEARSLPKNAGITVTFVDWDGTVLYTELIEIGGTVIPPNNPLRIGYRFTSWDKEFTSVTEDLIVTALYEPIIDIGEPEPKDPDIRESQESTSTPTAGGDAQAPTGKGAPKLGDVVFINAALSALFLGSATIIFIVHERKLRLIEAEVDSEE